MKPSIPSVLPPNGILAEHKGITRRFFLSLAGGTLAFPAPLRLMAASLPKECAEACQAYLDKMEYLTPQAYFGNVSRGNPRPYDLPKDKKREVGLVQETWKLEVLSDQDNQADLGNPYTLDWKGLMAMAGEHAVTVPKVMTCLNRGNPHGMGFWEGVPLREIIWKAKPEKNLRRVFYHGYHNGDPKQIFQSSLPIGRVLEDPFDIPPVLVCYKLNGEFLKGQRGGPVRMLVPEAYGFKSVKWLERVTLSNLPHANDTYANGNNDIDSYMKTFAKSLMRPKKIEAGKVFPATGFAQVGVSGLAKVQTLVLPKENAYSWPADDPYYTKADWQDADILPPPDEWPDKLPANLNKSNIHGFDPTTGKPKRWPLKFTWAHWATLLPALPKGDHTLLCRSIDENGHPQPMPRPFRKDGRNAIERVTLEVGA